MDVSSLQVPEQDADRVRQMQMSSMEWDEAGEAALKKGFRKGKRSKFMGEPLRLVAVGLYINGSSATVGEYVFGINTTSDRISHELVPEPTGDCVRTPQD